MAEPAAVLARRLGARIRRGTLVVEGEGGGWRAGAGDPVVRVRVRDRRAYRAVLFGGSEGLADSYVDGWWDADDLTGLVRLLLVNLSGLLARLDRVGSVVGRPLSGLRRAGGPSKATDRRNVRAHYDLPAPLFARMLDETMTYSCAVFERPDATLAEAQRAKLDRVCAKLALVPGDHVVEIGTGWGGFALHAARHYGCRVTTTTLSEAQRSVALAAVEEAGLTGRVEVLGLDYRELTGTYDKLVSIEMIEAVDWRRHDDFFGTCGRLVRPEGLMLLQAIVIADRSYERAKHHQDFIRATVFPGGCLPSVNAIVDSLTRASELRVVDLEDIGRHYPPTLRHWHDNFVAAWGSLGADGLDEGFRRLWELYLCYCEAAFLERHISDVQIVAAGPAWRAPLALRST